MVKFTDKRAGSPDRNGEKELRRPGPGHRTASDFFSEEAQRRDVTRGELLNVLAMVEYARHESLWWRKLWRWMTQTPQVVDMPARLVVAHAKTIETVATKLRAEAEEERIAQAKREAAFSVDLPK